MSAIHIDEAKDTIRVYPLWTGPLALDEAGNPAPAPRSYAQPALFQHSGGTGIIMGSVRSGVAILR